MNSISYKQAGMLQSVEKESLLLWYEWDATCREELGIRKPLSQPTLASMEAEMRLHAYEAGGRVGTCICNKSLIPRVSHLDCSRGAIVKSSGELTKKFRTLRKSSKTTRWQSSRRIVRRACSKRLNSEEPESYR